VADQFPAGLGFFQKIDHAVIQHGQRVRHLALDPPRQDGVEILVIAQRPVRIVRASGRLRETRVIGGRESGGIRVRRLRWC
jgi:hypothetical protein